MIKTTVVGSYPVPFWLRSISNRESLRDAMLAVIKTQELAGIDLVSDGELHRWDVNHAETNGMIDYFVKPLDGVQARLTTAQLERWRGRRGMAFRGESPGVVTGPIGPGRLNLRADYDRFRELTSQPKKFTVTSPYMLGRTLADDHYHDVEALVMALADVLRDQVARIDADVVQVDEASVTGRPADGPIAAEAINRVLGAVRGEKAVHLCFGNYGGQRVQEGSYDALAEFLGALDADHFVLELTRRPEGELAAIAGATEAALGIGVIDVKCTEVESPETVAARLERAANVAGAERIRYAHPDCGFWMLARSIADQKMRALFAGRNLFEGRG